MQSLHRERFVSGTSAIKKENPLASFNEEGLRPDKRIKYVLTHRKGAGKQRTIYERKGPKEEEKRFKVSVSRK